MATKRDYQAVRDAVIKACDALLFRATPPLSRTNREDRFILSKALNELVWKYSVATQYGDDKYESCEWWSECALAAFNKNSTAYKKVVALEHVVTREYLIGELIDAQDIDEIRSILSRAVTCVLLRTEHKEIKSKKSWRPVDHTNPEAWWERYHNNPSIKRVKFPR